jgi:hypothetical protein
MVAVESVRALLPAMVDEFAALLPQQRAAVINVRPDPYFGPAVIALLGRHRSPARHLDGVHVAMYRVQGTVALWRTGEADPWPASG